MNVLGALTTLGLIAVSAWLIWKGEGSPHRTDLDSSETQERLNRVLRDIGLAVLTGVIVGGVIWMITEARENDRLRTAGVNENTRFARQLSVDIPNGRKPLIGMNLSGASLGGLNLSRADLTGSDLSGSNMDGADLSGAVFTGANLAEATLAGADLSGAVFTGAVLTNATLSGATTGGTIDLEGADLSGAGLSGLDLSKSGLVEDQLPVDGLGAPTLRGVWWCDWDPPTFPPGYRVPDPSIYTCSSDRRPLAENFG